MTNDKFSTINGEKLYEGSFKPQTFDYKINDNSLIFCFSANKVLIFDNKIPNYKQFCEYNLKIEIIKPIGLLNELHCFCIQIKEDSSEISNDFIDLRQAYNILNPDFLKAAIYGYQVLLWNKRTQFCGACGTKTVEADNPDLVKICPECNESYYPKISPAIIVAIKKNGKLLMAQHKRLPDFYAIIAGFANPGESLEECVHREVMEETGVKIKKLEYFGSQPWPFPDSLMIGFKADYKSGILTPDQIEITDLKWFAADEIPEWGNRSSIARALIDDFIKDSKK